MGKVSLQFVADVEDLYCKRQVRCVSEELLVLTWDYVGLEILAINRQWIDSPLKESRGSVDCALSGG